MSKMKEVETKQKEKGERPSKDLQTDSQQAQAVEVHVQQQPVVASPKKKKHVQSLMVQHFNRLPKLQEYNIEISPETFLQIVGWSTQGYPNETAGHGIIEDNVAVWSCEAEIYAAHSSQVDSGTTESVIKAMAAGYSIDAINLHWHTHPGFGAYHSATDIENEMKIVEPLARQSPHGSFYFIVASALDWCVRKYVWFDNVLVGYHPGDVSIPEYGITLNQGRFKSTFVSASTKYSGGSYYGGSHSSKGRPYVKPMMLPDGKDIVTTELPDEASIDEFTVEYEGVEYAVKMSSDQPPPLRLTVEQELQCLPLFNKFAVGGFLWDELADAVYDHYNKDTDMSKITMEAMAEEKHILLEAIVETYMLDASVLESL